MALDKTTLSRNVRVLVRRGWLKAEGAEDQRVRILSVTPEGEEAFLRAFPYWERAQHRLAEGLGRTGTSVLYQHLEAAVRSANHV
jgi:DNA-binding MarR family transcriptional regulator